MKKKIVLSVEYIAIMLQQALDEITVAEIPEDLDLVERIYLKKGGRLEQMTLALRDVPIAKRPRLGHLINDFKARVTSAIRDRREQFKLRKEARRSEEQREAYKKRCPFGPETAMQCTPQRYLDCKQCERIAQPSVEFKPMRANQVQQHALYYVAAQARQAAHDIRNDDRFMTECAKIADELQKRADSLCKT